MRSAPSLASLAAAVASAIFLLAFVIISPDPLQAEPLAADAPSRSEQGAANCPEVQTREKPKLWYIPRFAGLGPDLDRSDETATLEAIHYTLNEVADGSAYIWHRRNGHLNGLVRPEMSFRNELGAVCRRITVALTAGDVTKRIEGVACREADKSWLLKG